MNSEKLSPRLTKVCEFLVHYQKDAIRLADIGSDHAYLPCHLALNKQLEFAIAGEVVEGPFQSAKAEVATRGLTEVIDVRKGDGLAVITETDQINAITICGMGGSLIRNILDENKAIIRENTVLVLQPNMASYQLRKWLNQNGFVFLNETVVEDHHREYEIMVVQKNSHHKQILTVNELQFGKYNLENPTVAFYQKWQKELSLLEAIYQSIVEKAGGDHPKAQLMQEEINQIKEVLN